MLTKFLQVANALPPFTFVTLSGNVTFNKVLFIEKGPFDKPAILVTSFPSIFDGIVRYSSVP